MIRCTRCKKRKPRAGFSNSKTRKGGKRAHCKDCEREQAREFYRRNPAPYKRRAGVQRDRIRKYLIIVQRDIKAERGCQLCPENEIACLDFHHLEKGRPVTRCLYSYAAFEREINKCVVICANCHRKVHAGLLKAPRKLLKKVRIKRL